MNDLKIVKLSEFPAFTNESLQLIEHSFQYQAPFRYEEDFFPLVQNENSSHRYLLLKNEKELIGHIGVKEKILTHHHFDFKVIFLGGIAIKESERGNGHFSLLLSDVIKRYQDQVPFIFLWSDKQAMYEKHGFELCIGQIQVDGSGNNQDLECSPYINLHWEDKKRIRELYSKTLEETCFSVKRGKNEWQEIENMKSANFYLKRVKERVVAYFVQDKGRDLNNIAHEFGFEEEKYLKEIVASSSATFWLPEKYLSLWPEAQVQYGSLVKIASPDLFHNFVSVWSDGEINTLKVEDKKVKFLFQDEIFTLGHQEFLASLFGPYPLKEFQNFNKNLFISGLDSI
ncbi:MAG: GNAT family N-acetyltransferase [Bacteriovoracaceae bacterium]